MIGDFISRTLSIVAAAVLIWFLFIDTSWAEPLDVRQHYHRGYESSAFGTYFKHGDCWITAHHVLKETEYNQPLFANGKLVSYQDLDIALIGCSKTGGVKVKPDQHVLIAGYPEGSKKITYRLGRIVRTGHVILEAGQMPVVTGMSGSPVLAFDGDWKITGVVTGSALFDHDHDARTKPREMVKYSPLSEAR